MDVDDEEEGKEKKEARKKEEVSATQQACCSKVLVAAAEAWTSSVTFWRGKMRRGRPAPQGKKWGGERGGGGRVALGDGGWVPRGRLE